MSIVFLSEVRVRKTKKDHRCFGCCELRSGTNCYHDRRGKCLRNSKYHRQVPIL